MLKKLRKRFICINMAIVTGMLLIIFILNFQLTNSDLNNKSNTALQTLSQSVMDNNLRNAEVRMPYFVIQQSILGEIKVTGNTHFDISNADFIHEIIRSVYAKRSDTGNLPEYDLKYKVISQPTVQSIICLDTSANGRALSSLIQTSIVTCIIALAAFTFISILLARWAVKPVDKAWQQQKQFISDASHELKTPLTVIMSNAELMQGAENMDPEHIQYTENILSSTKQMRRLVEGMLDLARADNGQIQTHFTDIDFSKIVNNAVLNFEAVFFEQGLTLNANVQENLIVHGSKQHLGQLIDILLDNAQKYSSPGIVDVELRRFGNSQCLITVSNPGTPIPTSDLEKIFQRFYRADSARTDSSSFGLGLSIAQRITQEHGGQIWAESNSSGNRFSILLPCFVQ